jgi:hypothetical protein
MRASSTLDASDFLNRLKRAIGARARDGGALQRAYERVAERLPETVPVRDLAAAFRAIEPAFPWAESHRASAAPLAETYAGALVVGPGGAVESDKVQIGVSLMAPEITFPDHQHPPEEVYIALSAGAWRQNADPWVEPGIGGLIYNPPNIAHAMRSGKEPFLAIWCLPLD